MREFPTGLWTSEGYGWLLQFGAPGYRLHHLGRGNVIAGEQGTAADFAQAYDLVELTSGRMSLRQAGDITRYDFRPTAAFPGLPQIDAPLRDPRANFDTLWDLFDEHYAFFDLHGVDWREARTLHRPRVDASTTDEQLLEVFRDLLLPLDDGHVSLAAGAQSIQCLRAMPLRRAMQAAFGAPEPRVSPRCTVDAVSPKLADLVAGVPLKAAGNGILSWGRLTGDVGYLSVLRLFGFADSQAARVANDLPHARRDVAAFLRDDLAALETALDAIFADLSSCRGLVVDLRINGGGFDRCGLAIANRFADKVRVAFTKQARAGNGLTPAQSFGVEPSSRPGFAGPVVVLTSPLCVSAGEILVLCLRALPQVRIAGEPTAGMLSDNLNKPLPNGWELSLSNEIYKSFDAQVFEGRGIEPEVALRTMDAGSLGESMGESLAQAASILARV